MCAVLWRGSLRFGLLDVPVALHPGAESQDLEFVQLDRRDLTPVALRKVNRATGQEVPPEDIVRGFEYSKGRFVTVTDEDLRQAAVERTRRADIVACVRAEEIDPSYFERPYVLEPDEAGQKGYALLREALRKTGRVGIARVVIRTRGYVAAVRPSGRALAVNLLRYRHELRDPEELRLPPEEGARLGIADLEARLAERLVEEMTESWNPERYRDEYREEVLAFLRRKIAAREGEGLEAPAPEEEGIVDFSGLLRRSLERLQESRRSKAG